MFKSCRQKQFNLNPFLLSQLCLSFLFVMSCGDKVVVQSSEKEQDVDAVQCEVGSLGCPCSGLDVCQGNLSCVDGMCTFQNCTMGALGCACEEDGSCEENAACNVYGYCESNDGKIGGECFANRTCLPGAICTGEGMCEECEAGSPGCDCLPNETCSDGFECFAGHCIESENANPFPENPECYSPCKKGYIDANGNYRDCSLEGLMRGCIGGAQCIQGMCVKDDEPVLSCESDLGCSDFQVCIDGQCISNCKYDSDCGSFRKCYRHSCRLPCEAEQDSCPDDTYCSIIDGDRGFCMPLAVPDEEDEQKRIEGTFEISESFIRFSNTFITTSFDITNHSARPLNFTVTRLEHTEYTPEGRVRVTENPMPWLAIGREGNAMRVNQYEVRIPGNGGKSTVEVSNTGDPIPAKWEGAIEITGDSIGTKKITLDYSQSPDGRWSGKVYYFNQFGESEVEAWKSVVREMNEGMLDGAIEDEVVVGNAFVQQWSSMRQSRIGLDQFNAVLTSTITGSWNWPSVREICPVDADACYLYSNNTGYVVYTDNILTAPIPSGIIELPIALDLKIDEDGSSEIGQTMMRGRIASNASLQYAGDPEISLSFSDFSTGCDGEGEICLRFLSDLSSDVVVGGRYHTTSGDTNCSLVSEDQFELVQIPWIVPGFVDGTEFDAENGVSYRYECRDKTQPFGMADEEALPLNLSLAISNPIPDGKSRRRHIELIDGMLINQETLYIIFKETFASFLGGEDETFSAYGFMMLERSPAQLPDTAFEGNIQQDNRESEVDLTDEVSCSRDLLSQIDGFDGELDPGDEDEISSVVIALINGSADAGNDDARQSYNPNRVHYLCHETGLFDTGPPSDRNSNDDSRVTCPASSDVTFFTGAEVPNNLSGFECQITQNCQQVLDRWANDPGFEIVFLNNYWRCEEDADGEFRVFCDDDREDVRTGKVFFVPEENGGDPPDFVPLRTAISNAFRYKSRFKNRQGTNIGFVPEICVPNSNAVPYCYDPQGIEQIRKRVDCVTGIFSDHYEALNRPAQDLARDFLRFNFAYDREAIQGRDSIYTDGFERLNAELLIMLGDEAYTDSFRSRFDLAGLSIASFEGELFEPNGINLSGLAGYEMFNLYKATQYYQMVLDRFYSLSPWIWRSLNANTNNADARNFIQQESVTSYFNRLLRASTQRARAWSEIAKRYQNFNRPDLARFVIQRAYTAAYLESIILGRLVKRVMAAVGPAERPQLRFEIDKAANIYRAALLDMRDVYGDITDDINYFGFPPDYIPMPALEPGGQNPFEVLINRANQSARDAAIKEDLAINSNRSFETDSASFQAELSRIRNTYENQLAEICGTFTGQDGVVYPAIPRYAYLDSRAKLLGDPCGLMGNGALWDAIGTLELKEIDIQSQVQAFENLDREIQIEKNRVNDQCDAAYELGDFRYRLRGQVNSLQQDIRNSRNTIQTLERQLGITGQFADLMSCVIGTSNDCATKAIAFAMYAGISTALQTAVAVEQSSITNKESQIDALEREGILFETQHQCDTMKIDSEASIANKVLRFREIEIEGLKTSYNIKLSLSQISKLRDQATRLMAEQEETQQLSINIEAARNDPNVRIYKNDAVINAERTFYAAIRNAYRATKIFEYYTSQSYERLGNLSLVRMVSRGDYNLENYLRELEEAYYEFNETFGRPNLRVDILSVRDDLLNIPRYSNEGVALTQNERVALFREALVDPRMLDGRGYLSIPFATSLGRLSPLTRNHKISSMEAEIIGSDVGNTVGRVYLSQAGTGVIHALNDQKSYYRFPERTAVVNPFFNGVRVFLPDVYRNERLRDRPLVNTNWEFILNQRDELANQDINLKALTDIRLYFYYTDFTEL